MYMSETISNCLDVGHCTAQTVQFVKGKSTIEINTILNTCIRGQCASSNS